ncbi:nuclease-related domain-containing protein [Pedococcus sp. NPDC057267]|uniref:nuclease-related domain-containing protein n=1 Tax=Pedococcus sp. NPDC057267 TaxID=3346077 RepID=UPI0036261570
MAVGGGSADRRAEELGSQGDPNAAKWAAGADGERRVADELVNLREAWTVLHDRLIRPGRSESNLDHVVVGPGGLFLIDAKNWSGDVTAWDGGLYQHLGQGGQRTSQSKHAEVLKVHGMASYMSVETGLPTTPVICLAGPSQKKFGEPQFIKGVWVVPISALVSWLESRPVVLDREAAARAVTRAMTSFPSTTTDPALLAAMGAAFTPSKRSGRRTTASTPNRARRGGRAARPVTVSVPLRGRQREVPFAARLGRAIGKLFLVAFALTVGIALLPPLFSAATKRLVPHDALLPPLSAHTATATATGVRRAAAPELPVVGPPDCANASASEVAKILGRKVQPVAVYSGCAWGTRLDDASTTLVIIQLPAEPGIYRTQLTTSVKQKRVVFGIAPDAKFRPAAALWVASGQPITIGKPGLTARADTYVVVSRSALGISDDRARQIAVAIAAAANGTS